MRRTHLLRQIASERAARRVEECVTYTSKNLANEIEGADWNRLVYEDHFVDKLALDRSTERRTPTETAPHLIPEALDELQRELLQTNDALNVRHLPIFATRSDCTLARALFYQELTRELEIPYGPGQVLRSS
jgi:hypothetical protein